MLYFTPKFSEGLFLEKRVRDDFRKDGWFS